MDAKQQFEKYFRDNNVLLIKYTHFDITHTAVACRNKIYQVIPSTTGMIYFPQHYDQQMIINDVTVCGTTKYEKVDSIAKKLSDQYLNSKYHDYPDHLIDILCDRVDKSRYRVPNLLYPITIFIGCIATIIIVSKYYHNIL